MLAGAILAGGQNRRMGGKPKALLRFGDELLIERQIREMEKICIEIIVVTNDPEIYLPLVDASVKISPDIFAGKGPLSGIHAALSITSQSCVWVAACDMPFISAKAANLLLMLKQRMEPDIVIPDVGGRLQPLHGIYDRSLAERIAVKLKADDLRLMGLLEQAKWESVGEEVFTKHAVHPAFTMNVNSPEDYEQAIQALGIGRL